MPDNTPANTKDHDENQGEKGHILTIEELGWAGPIPSPRTLQQFDDILPGSAERIFAQFEAEAAHRRRCEAEELRFRERESHVGQFLAGIFAVGAFGVTAFALHVGAYSVAGLVGTTTVLTGVAAFLNRKNPRVSSIDSDDEG
ncbi:DUF2335 domain-containing protein [Methylocella tundrae]|uniref:DUF2335 domain-containing protein n=1 Tax=Methylocella tundrae TaxID=227605 RepID=A0A4U8Z356_METTU|nr:DUF2335 domain-containing protein [Methylocella tundrae]WPP03718.1 DUF2335 domain-containing protein [Methylocella tundrae]VFU09864.1 protein of unknown function [Methylocella tundrae]